MSDITLQVSEALELINQTLDQAYPFIVVEGEVANFKVSKQKYVFFDLKDATGILSCFMMVFSLKFPIEDGMTVCIVAQPRLTQWGKFSLTVRELTPVGEGSLKKSFELLKTKLTAEGLFDESRKRALPEFPLRIGVVSSAQAAGFADFIKIVAQRFGGLYIILADVNVQGTEAPKQIVTALQNLNELSQPLDVIAVVRGGGSAEDLSAFNHEDVVRAISNSRTPTIVGVGHEIDTTLSDLAADVRASTPSNAAELIVPDKEYILHKVQNQVSQIHQNMETHIERLLIDQQSIQGDITIKLNTFFDQNIESVIAARRTIDQLNPAAVLKRGYGILRQADTVVSHLADVTIGDTMSVEISDGIITGKVINVSKK